MRPTRIRRRREYGGARRRRTETTHPYRKFRVLRRDLMRRAIVALVSTIVGLVLLLGFKSHSSAGTGLVATAPHHPAKAKATPTPKPKSSPATKKRSTSTVTSTRTVTGDSVDTSYGPVQVRVTVKGSRITDVQAVQLPQGSSRDIEIDNY